MPEIEDYHYQGSLRDDPKRKLKTLMSKLGPRKMGGLIATLVVAVMLPVTLIAVQMQQNFRQRAATMPITSPISITSAPTSTPSLTPPPTGGITTPTSTPRLTPTSTPRLTPTPTPMPLYSLTGQVFIDTNRNKLKDAGEGNYAFGATVILSDGQKALTNPLGVYTFSNLKSGSYKVALSPVPQAYGSTTQNPVTMVFPDYSTAKPAVNFGIAPLPTSTPTAVPTKPKPSAPSEPPITGGPVFIPAITGAGVVQTYNPWVVWVTGGNFQLTSTVKVYDSNGTFWANGVGMAYGSATNLSFSLPSNTPPSGCNRNTSCTIFVEVANGPYTSNRYAFSLPQYSQQTTTVTVIAEGTQAAGAYPTMDLYLKGVIVKRWTNVTGGMKQYTYTHQGALTRSDVRVMFSNDATASGQDRNLRVDKIRINSAEYQSEASTTYTTSCSTGYKRTEWLYCNGYFQY